MSLLAIIPARGGSKGIKRKNIKPLLGKPLIGWTIEAAKKAACVDRVIVSTDDTEIANIAISFGAEVPFMRPVELAQDETPGMAPVLHAIEQLPDYEWVLLLQPTSPLRTSGDIDDIWHFCQNHAALSVVSVCDVKTHPNWMYQLDVDGRLSPLMQGSFNTVRRQDLHPYYVLNGAFYLARTNWLKKQGNFIGTETLGYVMPAEKSVDIDTFQEWEWVEYLMEKINGK